MTCMEASTSEKYVINYADSKVISKTGALTIQNRNDFDIVFTGNVDDINIKDVESSRLKDFIDNYVDYDIVVVQLDELGKAASCCERSVLMLQQTEYSEMSAQQKVKNLDKQGCYVLGVIINE